MTKKIKIKFFNDPGHGWAKVKRSELIKYGIDNKISNCSYQRGEWVYLEEDSDVSHYVNALKENKVEFCFVESYCNGKSRIRTYESYSPELKKSEAKEHWIDVCKRIVKNHQYEEVDGVLVDATTASVIVKVFEALKEEKNILKFKSLSIQLAAKISWDMVK